ncbi:hypothetical protein B0H17DRAFT_1270930 [Mycena rosella]|uniref:Uncharacterized protein n=1 Tax=Mycena rosella TaxID=1033263 RepID=A0AAD7G162_MYCRO|nr:hypothetical protein B0H17DRAFT_1270930 [Mycena rosella]
MSRVQGGDSGVNVKAPKSPSPPFNHSDSCLEQCRNVSEPESVGGQREICENLNAAMVESHGRRQQPEREHTTGSRSWISELFDLSISSQYDRISVKTGELIFTVAGCLSRSCTEKLAAYIPLARSPSDRTSGSLGASHLQSTARISGASSRWYAQARRATSRHEGNAALMAARGAKHVLEGRVQMQPLQRAYAWRKRTAQPRCDLRAEQRRAREERRARCTKVASHCTISYSSFLPPFILRNPPQIHARVRRNVETRLGGVRTQKYSMEWRTQEGRRGVITVCEEGAGTNSKLEAAEPSNASPARCFAIQPAEECAERASFEDERFQKSEYVQKILENKQGTSVASIWASRRCEVSHLRGRVAVAVWDRVNIRDPNALTRARACKSKSNPSADPLPLPFHVRCDVADQGMSKETWKGEDRKSGRESADMSSGLTDLTAGYERKSWGREMIVAPAVRIDGHLRGVLTFSPPSSTASSFFTRAGAGNRSNAVMSARLSPQSLGRDSGLTVTEIAIPGGYEGAGAADEQFEAEGRSMYIQSTRTVVCARGLIQGLTAGAHSRALLIAATSAFAAGLLLRLRRWEKWKSGVGDHSGSKEMKGEEDGCRYNSNAENPLPSASTVSAAPYADMVFVRAGLSGHGRGMSTSPGMTGTYAFVLAEGEANADIRTLCAGASGRAHRTSTLHGTTERYEWSQLRRVRSTLSGSCFAISVWDVVAAAAIAMGKAHVDVVTLCAGASGLERGISTSCRLKEMPQDSNKVLGSLVRSERGRGMMSWGSAELHTRCKGSNVPLAQRLPISHIATAR